MTLDSSFIRCMNFKTKLRVLFKNDLEKQKNALISIGKKDYLIFKIETAALTGEQR